MNWNENCLTGRQTYTILWVYSGIIQWYCISTQRNLFHEEILMTYFITSQFLLTDVELIKREGMYPQLNMHLDQFHKLISTHLLGKSFKFHLPTSLKIYLHTRLHHDQEHRITLTSAGAYQTAHLMIHLYVVPSKVAFGALWCSQNTLSEKRWHCKLNRKWELCSWLTAMGTSSHYQTSCCLFYRKLISRHTLKVFFCQTQWNWAMAYILPGNTSTSVSWLDKV